MKIIQTRSTKGNVEGEGKKKKQPNSGIWEENEKVLVTWWMWGLGEESRTEGSFILFSTNI